MKLASRRSSLGGKRGTVSTFSSASRRRLMRLFARVREDLPGHFVTLTWQREDVSVLEHKRAMSVLRKRIARAFPASWYVWRLEFQKRGTPHAHLIVYGVDDPGDWFAENWVDITRQDTIVLDWHLGKLGNGNRHCTQELSGKGAQIYCAKYLAKRSDFSVPTGRCWGQSGNSDDYLYPVDSFEFSGSDFYAFRRSIWKLPFFRRSRLKKMLNRTVIVSKDTIDKALFSVILQEQYRDEVPPHPPARYAVHSALKGQKELDYV